MFKRFVIAILIGCFVQVSYAQDECSGATLAGELELFVSILEASDTPLDTMSLIDNWVNTAIVNCTDEEVDPVVEDNPEKPTMVFSSAENGMQPVLGPIDISDGLYRVKVVTDGYFIGQVEELDGDCITGTLGLFNLTSGIASNGAFALFGSIGCSGLIKISNTTDEWVMEFYAIDLGKSVPVENIYSSDDLGLYSVTDLISFEDGLYRVKVETDGYFIGNIESIDGNCDSGILGLFNLSQGQASNGAENTLSTSGCVGILTTTNVTEPWTLTFEKIR